MKKKVRGTFRGIIIFLLCMVEIYPLFWMLTASFKKQAEWSEKPAYALNNGFYFQKPNERGVGQRIGNRRNCRRSRRGCAACFNRVPHVGRV